MDWWFGLGKASHFSSTRTRGNLNHGLGENKTNSQTSLSSRHFSRQSERSAVHELWPQCEDFRVGRRILAAAPQREKWRTELWMPGIMASRGNQLFVVEYCRSTCKKRHPFSKLVQLRASFSVSSSNQEQALGEVGMESHHLSLCNMEAWNNP